MQPGLLFNALTFVLLTFFVSSAFTFWPHDERSIYQREKNRNLTEEGQHRAWNEQYQDDLKVSIEIPSLFVDPVLPVFDNETSKDIEAGEWEAFARNTNKLWTLAKKNEERPFECSSSKCKSPFDYFAGVPVISGGGTGKHNHYHLIFYISSSEHRALFGEEIELICEVWIGWAGEADVDISWVNSHGEEYKLNSSKSLVEVEQAVSQSGFSITSYLRITQLSEEDGGEYFCRKEDDPTKQSTKVSFVYVFRTI